MPDKRFAHLFKQYFDKTATNAEREELMLLISREKSEQKLLQMMQEQYLNHVPETDPFSEGQKEKMYRQISLSINPIQEKSLWKRLIPAARIWRYAAAASLLICLGIFTYKLVNLKSPYTQLAENDFNPGGDKAILTLSNGSTIDLSGAQNGMLSNQGGVKVNKTHSGEIVYDISGAEATDTNGQTSYNTISTPRGGQYQVVLSDGSKVWLNSFSSLKFPAHFSGNKRQVEITGEAYFEVSKNKSMPFHVKSGGQIVEVLGTHFNVNSYSDEPDTKTTLLEGAVRIRQLNNGFSALLKPGQQAVNTHSGPIRVQSADIGQVVAWKSGLFQITNADIETIMRQAARWYDVDIEYQGQIPRRKFSGKIKRDVKASEFLEMLTFFNVRFSIEGRKIIVKN